ncbi:MAG: hypothetical protein ABI672_00655 [Vicinamibacteria bacterium]
MKPLPPGEALTESQRTDAISRASVWAPTDIKSVNFKTGPKIDGGYSYNQWVTCEYKEKKMTGASPKFTCETKADKSIKVKYGLRNAEIYGEVLSTRLFWALGFPADTMFPVRVRCKGCSADPQRNPAKTHTTQEFDPAVVEQKLAGRIMETHEDSGWEWSELDNIGPNAPRDARTHRDALKLLGAFIQHSDSKPSNQRLVCPKGEKVGKLGCKAPVMMVQDLGLTFGEAGLLNKNQDSASLQNWIDVPVWKPGETCVAELKGSFTGHFTDPKISEAGRAFLANLLIQLSDQQLADLFETARIGKRSAGPSRDPKKDAPPASVEEWVKVFKTKRAQIVDRRCPA